MFAVGILGRIPLLLSTVTVVDRYAIGMGLLASLGLLLAGVLWLWPGVLAWWASSRASREVLELQLGPDQLQRIALSVLGAWLGVSGVAGCLSHGLTMLLMRQRLGDFVTQALPVSEWRSLIYYLVLLVAGAALMIGAEGLVRLLHRLRGRPIDESAASVCRDADSTR